MRRHFEFSKQNKQTKKQQKHSRSNVENEFGKAHVLFFSSSLFFANNHGQQQQFFFEIGSNLKQ